MKGLEIQNEKNELLNAMKLILSTNKGPLNQFQVAAAPLNGKPIYSKIR